MAIRRKTKKALAMLLPTGMLGISSALASVHPQPLPHERNDSPERVSAVGDRLREIRSGVSEMNALARVGGAWFSSLCSPRSFGRLRAVLSSKYFGDRLLGVERLPIHNRINGHFVCELPQCLLQGMCPSA